MTLIDEVLTIKDFFIKTGCAFDQAIKLMNVEPDKNAEAIEQIKNNPYDYTNILSQSAEINWKILQKKNDDIRTYKTKFRSDNSINMSLSSKNSDNYQLNYTIGKSNLNIQKYKKEKTVFNLSADETTIENDNGLITINKKDGVINYKTPVVCDSSIDLELRYFNNELYQVMVNFKTYKKSALTINGEYKLKIQPVRNNIYISLYFSARNGRHYQIAKTEREGDLSYSELEDIINYYLILINSYAVSKGTTLISNGALIIKNLINDTCDNYAFLKNIQTDFAGIYLNSLLQGYIEEYSSLPIYQDEKKSLVKTLNYTSS